MLILMLILVLTVISTGTMTQSTTNISLIDTEIVLRQSSITPRVAAGYEGKRKNMIIIQDLISIVPLVSLSQLIINCFNLKLIIEIQLSIGSLITCNLYITPVSSCYCQNPSTRNVKIPTKARRSFRKFPLI